MSPGLFHVGGISLVASPKTEERFRTYLRMRMPPALLAPYRSFRVGQAVSCDESHLTLIFQTYGRELQRAPAPTGDVHD